jgi:DNA-binding SARP family transcriptional activator
LWGERSDGQARASLRQTLSELRTVLGGSAEHSIIATKENITWVSGSAWIDAKVLESAAGSKEEDTLSEAADLINGELMEGFSVSEAGFGRWLAGERELFRLIACGIYARLEERAEQRGKLEEALSLGLKLLSLDPLQEHVHRALMRIYAAQGRHDAALAQYERCRTELSTQIGVSPEAETEALVKSIRANRRTKAQGQPSPAREPDAPVLPAKPSIAVPGIERRLLASAAIRLASTGKPSPPTRLAAMQAATKSRDNAAPVHHKPSPSREPRQPRTR